MYHKSKTDLEWEEVTELASEGDMRVFLSGLGFDSYRVHKWQEEEGIGLRNNMTIKHR